MKSQMKKDRFILVVCNLSLPRKGTKNGRVTILITGTAEERPVVQRNSPNHLRDMTMTFAAESSNSTKILFPA